MFTQKETKTISSRDLEVFESSLVYAGNRVIRADVRFHVLKMQGWKCNICFCVLKFSAKSNWDGEVAHIDHVFPLSQSKDYQNGSLLINEIRNLQALCPRCNQTKGKKR